MRRTYVHNGRSMVPKPPPAVHPKRSRTHEAPTIMDEIKPFWSPVDGTYVETRAQHRRHNRTNGVTDVGDDPMFMNPKSGSAYTPLPKAGRVEDIKAAMEIHGAR